MRVVKAVDVGVPDSHRDIACLGQLRLAPKWLKCSQLIGHLAPAEGNGPIAAIDVNRSFHIRPYRLGRLFCKERDAEKMASRVADYKTG